ncbi:hypothetical protein HGB13_01285 [bacterium]|nr:hypothetical protein [bacterium]
MLKINVSRIIDRKVSEEEFCFEIRNLSDDIKLVSPLLVSGKIVGKGASVVVYFNIKGLEEVSCDKCLEKFTRTIDRNFEQEYVFLGTDDKEEILEELAGFLIDDKGVIDIEKAIIEEISVNDLGLNVCSKTCKGLCPKCGVNLNKTKCSCYNKNEGDNPFAKLSKLKEK